MLYSSEIPETNKRENYVLIKEVERILTASSH